MKGFAPVTPIWLLQKMGQDAGRYHLPLAHDALKHPNEYQAFFHHMGVSSGHSYGGSHLASLDRIVILDNSVIELGDAVNTNMLLEAARICRATHIVLPDKLQNSIETYNLSYKAWCEMHYDVRGNHRIAVVPQGESLETWIKCAEMMAESIGVDLWCVPRNFEDRLGTRWDACEILRMIKNVPIHLIGFSDWIYKDMYAASHPNVIGIDSAVPIRVGQEGTDIMLSGLYKSRGEWFDSVTSSTPLDMAVLRNLKKVRGWLNP